MLTEMSSRRIKSVTVSAAAIQGLIKEGDRRYVFAGLPEDATVAGTWHDKGRQSFVIIFEHSSFDEVHDGHVIPDLEVTVSVHTPETPEDQHDIAAALEALAEAAQAGTVSLAAVKRKLGITDLD